MEKIISIEKGIETLQKVAAIKREFAEHCWEDYKILLNDDCLSISLKYASLVIWFNPPEAYRPDRPAYVIHLNSGVASREGLNINEIQDVKIYDYDADIKAAVYELVEKYQLN